MDVGFEFLYQTIASGYILAAFLSLAVVQLVGLSEAMSLMFGVTWGCVNLILIKEVMKNLLPADSRNFLKMALLLIFKFPLLYFLGYLAFSLTNWPPFYSLIGFCLVLLILTIKWTASLARPKACLLLLSLLAPGLTLQASLTTDVPEVPNIFTFLYKGINAPWTSFLHQWESIIFSILLAIVMAILFSRGVRRCQPIPTTRWQNFLELIAEGMDKFTHEILGPKGKKFAPFLGTLFIYILMMNWMVLFPFMKPPSSNLSVTVALGLCVFALVQYLSIRNFGFFGYLHHMAGSPKGLSGWLLAPLMLAIEIITQISRPITLAFRLFGNVMGEDILIGAFALFGVALFAFSPVGVPLQMPFMLFALMTGLMQALVFTLLSAIYILLSMPEENEHP